MSSTEETSELETLRYLKDKFTSYLKDIRYQYQDREYPIIDKDDVDEVLSLLDSTIDTIKWDARWQGEMDERNRYRYDDE